MYKPALKQGKAHKFVGPFTGPYRVTKLYSNGADLKLISKPAAAVIQVSLNRIRLCPSEVGTPTATEASQDETSIPDAKDDETTQPNSTTQQSLSAGSSNSVWTGQLWNRRL